MINLTDNCNIGSPKWFANVKEIKETEPENFIFYVDAFGNNTLKDLVREFPIHKRYMIKKEVIKNLEHYARFDLASMYKILKEKYDTETERSK